MVLNFKEIPQANTGNGDQDTFELFARDFLENFGCIIIRQPSRGADGKKDIIIEESHRGIFGCIKTRWLVSCKHFAHSGKAVSEKDELNILERVEGFECNGFLGFYSTVMTSAFETRLDSLKEKINIGCFDSGKIEKCLLGSPSGLELARRYFSSSLEKYKVENPTPVKLFSDDSIITCEYCGKNLLEEKRGNFVTLRAFPDEQSHNHTSIHYKYAYYCCKGKCDNILKRRYIQNEPLFDEWTDISDFLSPALYMEKFMVWISDIHNNKYTLDTEAFEKLKKLFIHSFQYICREQTTKEKEHIMPSLKNGFIDLMS